MLQCYVRLSSVTYVLWLNGASCRKLSAEAKQEMAYGKSHGHVTDDVTWPWKVLGQRRDPNTLRAQCHENSWRCYLATIANYNSAERQYGWLAILAIASLLVSFWQCKDVRSFNRFGIQRPNCLTPTVCQRPTDRFAAHTLICDRRIRLGTTTKQSFDILWQSFN